VTQPSKEAVAAALAKLQALVDQAKAAAPAPTPAPPQQKLTLTELLAQKQKQAEKQPTVIEVPTQAALQAAFAAHPISTVAWNEKQAEAIKLSRQGKSFCLIGAAGTGKTTTLKGCIQTLEVNNLIEPLRSGSKYLMVGSYGMVLVSYTRRAVRQIARQMPASLARHALTIHKLIEFEPVYLDVITPEGNMKKTMRFEPQRTRMNPLPREVTRCVIDESSMVSTDLFEMLKDALPRNCQFIFLGDLHQLPPVYGEAVLANKLQELPVVELTEVYRQALDSPIIKLATDLKDGKDIPVTGKVKWESPDGSSKVVINPWPKQISGEDAMDGLAGTIKQVIKSGNFNEEEDVILMPFNKSCGTIELNLHIANTLAVQRGAVVHHCIAGFQHWYLAVGDRVLVDKQDCVIRGIERNPKYSGKAPLELSASLDRWGTYQDDQVHHHLMDDDADIDAMLQRMSEIDVEDKQNAASHVLILENLDDGREYRVSEVGTYNSMVFSWALTVHKSQGSEWRRVFLFLHQSHHAMCSRELLYTAVTRAREELIIICEPDRRDSAGTLTKAARNPRIKGNTLAEKLEWLRLRAKEKMGKNGEDDLYGK
jgi:hypothetical protein